MHKFKKVKFDLYDVPRQFSPIELIKKKIAITQQKEKKKNYDNLNDVLSEIRGLNDKKSTLKSKATADIIDPVQTNLDNQVIAELEKEIVTKNKLAIELTNRFLENDFTFEINILRLIYALANKLIIKTDELLIEKQTYVNDDKEMEINKKLDNIAKQFFEIGEYSTQLNYALIKKKQIIRTLP